MSATAIDNESPISVEPPFMTSMLEPWRMPDLYVRQRVRAIAAGDTPVPIASGTTIEVLHLIPVECVARQVRSVQRVPMLFSSDGSTRSRVFHDGNLGVHDWSGDGVVNAYSHIRRDSVVEAVSTGRMKVHEDADNSFGRGLSLDGLESALTSSLDGLARVARRGVDDKFELRAYLSLLRASDSWIEQGFPGHRHRDRFLSDEIVFPPVMVGDTEAAGEQLARFVWQAGGHDHNPAYPWEAS